MPTGFYPRRSLFLRLQEKVDPDGPLNLPELGQCSKWLGSSTSKGYGRIGLDNRVILAHRAAYELGSGQAIPAGLCVLHHCDYPPCTVFPHLFLGTQADNMVDKVRKGRSRKGIPLTPQHRAALRRG